MTGASEIPARIATRKQNRSIIRRYAPLINSLLPRGTRRRLFAQDMMDSLLVLQRRLKRKTWRIRLPGSGTPVQLIHHAGILAGFIDKSHWRGDTLEISGWAMNPVTKGPVTQVIVTDDDGHFLNLVDISKDRRDIVRKTGNNALLKSGWTVSLDRSTGDFMVFSYCEKEGTAYHVLPSGDLKYQLFRDKKGWSDVRQNPGEGLLTFMQLRMNEFVRNYGAVMRFPEYPDPAVSIIILTYNKAEHTHACLESILAHSDIPYEVIVVDNGSTDSTRELLGRMPGLRVEYNGENAGFIRGCNQGAAMARAPYLLFLNNDTFVTPGWLSTLIRTIDSAPGCGVLGCRLVYPNGSLQEAGSIIWSDGSCMGYGRGDDPDLPQYNYAREVDYCSGACLLTRSELFGKAGGFDSLYLPAYYEETDYCMKVRESGYTVLYEPKATVFHNEFVSSSFSPAIELMEANRQKFITRWSAALAKQPDPDADSIFLARDRRPGERVLVIDDRIPLASQGSGFPRARHLYSEMAELGYIVTLFPADRKDPFQPTTREFQEKGIEVIYESDEDLESFVQNRTGFYDLVFVSRPHNLEKSWQAIKEFQPKARLVYDAEALFSVRDVLKLESMGESVSGKSRQVQIGREVELMNRADVVTVVSEKERELALANGLTKPVFILGHTIDVREDTPGFTERSGILFVGSFIAQTGPNVDAALLFIREIFPRIRKEIGCTLYIVGRDPPPVIREAASADVIVTGFVDDIREYYDRCRVFVVPHQYAGGIPWKLTESWANGIPAVVSPLIAEEFGIADGQEVLVGKDSGQFARSVIRLHSEKDLWEAIQRNGFDFIRKTHDSAEYRNTLKAVLEAVR